MNEKLLYLLVYSDKNAVSMFLVKNICLM